MAKQKYLTLEGLRGLAALLVVYFHQCTAGISPAPTSFYLAVDLFFLMSGFVIAHAYEDRLGEGLSALAFMRLRLIRLYPLYILGSAIGLVVMAWFGRLSAFDPASAGDISRSAAGAVFMVPYLGPVKTLILFPLNGPAWSLLLEVLANLAYAVFARRLSTRALTAICVVSGLVLSGAALHDQTLNLGYQAHRLWVGVARVSFSFSLGVVIFRFYRAGRLPVVVLGPMPVMAGACALLLLPSLGNLPGLFAAAVVLVGFPTLMIAAVQARAPGPRLARMFGLSGEISYPLYAIHGPLIVGLMMASKFWNWPLPALQPWGVGLVIAPALAVLALGVSRAYDQPVRAWLSGFRPGVLVAVRRRLAALGV